MIFEKTYRKMKNKLGLLLLLVAMVMSSCHFRPNVADRQTDEFGFNTKAEVDSAMLDSMKVAMLTGDFDGMGVQQDSLLYFMNAMNSWQALPEALPYYALLADGGTPTVCGWIYDAMKQEDRLTDASCRAFAESYLERGVALGNDRCAERMVKLLEMEKGGKK